MADNQGLLRIVSEQRDELERRAQSRTLPAGDVFRARLTLALADGMSYREIERKMGASAPTVSKWKSRFEQKGMEGLQGQHQGSKPRRATPAVQARVIRRAQQKPSDGSTHWSCRRLSQELGVSKSTVHVKTGSVEGETAPRHTSTEFVGFLTALLRKAKWAREIHIVLDNLSAHKTQAVEQFLVDYPKVRLHFTPTYSSWVNQVEIWFAKIERDVIARGVFISVSDLRRKLMRYIRAYAKRARPIRWTYTDPKRRITAKRIVGTVN